MEKVILAQNDSLAALNKTVAFLEKTVNTQNKRIKQLEKILQLDENKHNEKLGKLYCKLLLVGLTIFM